MHQRILSSTWALGLVLATGCGSSGQPGLAPNDAGDAARGGDDLGDAEAPDARDAGNASSDDAGSPSSGDATTTTDAGASADGGQDSGATQLLAGAHLEPYAMTSDDHIVVFDRANDGLEAVDIGGGSVASIDPAFDDQSALYVTGKVVFSWTGVAASGTAPLRVWTHAAGTHAIDAVAIPHAGVGSTDGSKIVYLGNASVDGTSADLSIANADGTGKVTLAAGVFVDLSCPAVLVAAGTKIFASYCPTNVSGATVTVIDPATKTKMDVGTGLADSFSVDASGGHVFVATSGGVGSVYDVSSAPFTSSQIDTNVRGGRISADGAMLLYQTGDATATTFTLKKATSSGTGAITLATNLAQILALRGTLSEVVYATSIAGATGLCDLRLIPTASASPVPIDLLTTSTGGLFGAAFTSDGSRTLFYTGVDTTSFSGTLKSSTLTSATAITLSNNAWNDVAAGGSRVVFNDNWTDDGSGRTTGTTDLKEIDLSAASPSATPIASGVFQDFMLSSELDRVVYSLPTGGSAGLYVKTLP
jgi:hypothetical protein